jgi:hypothetical protein
MDHEPYTVVWITEDLRIGMDQVCSPDPLAAIEEAGVDLTGGADVVVLAGEAYEPRGGPGPLRG